MTIRIINIKKYYFLILVLFFAFFLFTPTVLAQVECGEKEVTIIARNSDGEFIPNINFSIYEQIFDVDNNPKPGNIVASGKTDAILGRGAVAFQDEDNSNTY